MSSPDGINWTGRSAAAANLWRSVAWGAGSVNLFVAVAATGTNNRVMTSTNGTSWNSITVGGTIGTIQWNGICWSPTLNLFCAVGGLTSNFGVIMTSPNGTTWTGRSSPDAINYTSVCWSPTLSLFIAVANTNSTGTNRIATSPDGITWTMRTATANSSWAAVAAK
jgi:hypothetical protein